MSTAPTAEVQASAPKPEAPKKTLIPTLSPYLAPMVICPNRKCFKVLTPKVSTQDGGEPQLRYDCEDCNYSFFSSLVHGQGICKQLGSNKKSPPEVFQKGK